MEIIQLSTPHGALGTQVKEAELKPSLIVLSTPHGALGTKITGEGFSPCQVFQLHTVH